MQNDLMNNPNFLAGLMRGHGKSYNDATSEAAIVAYNRQQVQAQQQKAAQAQFMAQQLPQVLRQLSGKSPEEAAAMLTQLGIPLEAAALVLERLGLTGGNTTASKSQMFKGADDMQYEAYKDETGRLMSRPIPGQQAPKKELTKNEQDDLKLFNEAGEAAKKTMTLVAEASDASKIFSNETGRNTAPNTLTSALTDPGADTGIAGTIGNYAIYNKKARAARQVMAKVNNSIVLETIQSLKGTGIRPSVFLEQIMKGTTPIDSMDDAAKEILYRDILRTAATVAAAAKFKQEYADRKGTLVGANSAFAQFRKVYGVQDPSNGEYYLVEPESGKYDISTDNNILDFLGAKSSGEDYIPESQPHYVEPPKSEWEMARDIAKKNGWIE